MAATYTEAEVEAILLRAQRAMLIISDRIQDNFLYLYSDVYRELKMRQYDIYILYSAISSELPFAPVDDNYYPLVQVLVSKCAEVDAYNSDYDTLNGNYVNIGGNSSIVVSPDPITINKTEADLVYLADTEQWYLPYTDDNGDALPQGVVPVFVIYNGLSLTYQYDSITNRIYGFASNDPATITITAI